MLPRLFREGWCLLGRAPICRLYTDWRTFQIPVCCEHGRVLMLSMCSRLMQHVFVHEYIFHDRRMVQQSHRRGRRRRTCVHRWRRRWRAACRMETKDWEDWVSQEGILHPLNSGRNMRVMGWWPRAILGHCDRWSGSTGLPARVCSSYIAPLGLGVCFPLGLLLDHL